MMRGYGGDDLVSHCRCLGGGGGGDVGGMLGVVRGVCEGRGRVIPTTREESEVLRCRVGRRPGMRRGR